MSVILKPFLRAEEDETTVRAHFDHLAEHKYFYEGTLHGWCSKYQKHLFCLFFTLFVLVFIIAIVGKELTALSRTFENFDDEDCWPNACVSSRIYTEQERSSLIYVYWEPVQTDFTGNSTEVEQWNFRYPTPSNRVLYSVIYGNGTFVAVGEDNSLLQYDQEEETWFMFPPVETALGMSHFDLSYGASTFWCTSSSGNYSSSSDGLSWSQTPVGFPDGIACSNYVCAGLQDNVLYLQSGYDWVPLYLPEAEALNSIVYFNNSFLVVGTIEYDVQESYLYATWNSTDGFFWDIHVPPQSSSLDDSEHLLLTVSYAEDESTGIWLLYADQLHYSYDAMTWIQSTTSPWSLSAYPEQITCALHGICVALTLTGDQSALSESFDSGNTWSTVIFGNKFYDIATDLENQFMVVGEMGIILAGEIGESFDSISWNDVGAAEDVRVPKQILYTSGEFLIPTDSEKILVSYDSISWMEIDAPRIDFMAHASDSTPLFIGLASSSTEVTIYSSLDAIEWIDTNVTFTGDYQLTSFIFDGSIFIATGRLCYYCVSDVYTSSEDSYVPIILHSLTSMAMEWVRIEPQHTSSYITRIVWNALSNVYLGISAYKEILVSEDLIDWEHSKKYSGRKYFAVDVNQRDGYAVALATEQSNSYTNLLISVDGGYQWSHLECQCTSCKFDQILYVRALDAFILTGAQMALLDATTYSLQVQSFPLDFESVEHSAFGNGLLVAISKNAIISAELEAQTLTDLC